MQWGSEEWGNTSFMSSEIFTELGLWVHAWFHRKNSSLAQRIHVGTLCLNHSWKQFEKRVFWKIQVPYWVYNYMKKLAKQPLNLMFVLAEYWCMFGVWHLTVIACANYHLAGLLHIISPALSYLHTFAIEDTEVFGINLHWHVFNSYTWS